MENNLYSLIANASWRRGEDGENIARELALALQDILKQGLAEQTNEALAKEFIRLIQPVST